MTPPRRTVRFVGARIEFDFMVDDGDTLEPFVLRNPDGTQGNPRTSILARDWPGFCETGLADLTAHLQAAVNAAPISLVPPELADELPMPSSQSDTR